MRKVNSFHAISVGAAIAMGAFTTFYMGWATAAYLQLAYGLWHRKNRAVHVRQMRIGLAADVALVLLLEVARDAIGTALSFKLGMLPQLHILFSTLALALYFPVFFLGNTRLKGRGTAATVTWHIRLGITAFILRSIGFILMFSLLAK